MLNYSAPLRDMKFVFREWLDVAAEPRCGEVLQNAASYASERRQMRTPVRRPGIAKRADPFALHPTIARILGQMRAVVEASAPWATGSS